MNQDKGILSKAQYDGTLILQNENMMVYNQLMVTKIKGIKRNHFIKYHYVLQ